MFSGEDLENIQKDMSCVIGKIRRYRPTGHIMIQIIHATTQRTPRRSF